MVSEGLPLGGLWYRDYLEVRQECTDREYGALPGRNFRSYRGSKPAPLHT